jgi:ABC-type glycerol-3-phosphate transport system permease component
MSAFTPAYAQPRFWSSKRAQNRVWLGLVTLVIALGSVLTLFPVAWMLTTSLKHPGDILLLPPKWIPIPPLWGNYPEALGFMRAQQVYTNTLLVTVVSLVGDVGSAALVAYGFARLRAPGKNALFLLLLSTLMIPYYVRLIPEYLLFAGKVLPQIRWVDTFLPLVVPTFFGSPFYIFLLRQFYQSVPLDMDDAAKIDGASYLQILLRIMMPLSLPALGTIAILSFVAHWNDFFRPLIYLPSRANYTVAIALRGFTAEYGQTPWHLLMAASFTALLPIVVIFFVAQRYFVQGVVITGLKG